MVGAVDGTGGGAILEVVGGATLGALGVCFGGNGGDEIVGGATLGGTTVEGFAVGEIVGIFGGVGIGELGVEGGAFEAGGPVEGNLGIDGMLLEEGGPDCGTPGTGGAVGGIPGVLDEDGGGGVDGVGALGITSPRNLSWLCSRLAAKD